MDEAEEKSVEERGYDWRKEMPDIPLKSPLPPIPYTPRYGRTKTNQELRQDCLELANAQDWSADAIVQKANTFYKFIKEGLVP